MASHDTRPGAGIARALINTTMTFAAVLAVAASAGAQSCTSAQYGSFTQGNYFVQNDEWGLANGSGSETICPGSASNNSWTATWDWDSGDGSLKAYPSIVSGWQYGTWSPNHNGFPVQVSANAPMPTSVTFTMSGNNQFDSAYDLFFSPSTNPSGPSAELMVWIKNSGTQPIGSKVASGVTIGGVSGTWDVWIGTNSWPVWSFVSDQQGTSFSGNLQPFIYYVAYSHNYLSTSWYALNIEFGTEINQSYNGGGGIDVTSFSGTAQGSVGGGGTGGGGGSYGGAHSLTPECATGSRLDDSAASTVNLNKIDIYAANGTNAQTWNTSSTGVTPAGDYNLAVNLGPYCLSTNGTTSGSLAVLYACNGSAGEAWNIAADSSPAGYYQLHPSNATGLCLDVEGAGTANGTQVDVYTCNQTNAQQWSGL